MAAEQSHQGLVRFKASGGKAEQVLRKSELSNFAFSSILPVRKPFPSGL